MTAATSVTDAPATQALRNVFRDSELNRRFAEDGYVVVPFLTTSDLSSLQKAFTELHPGDLPPFYTTIWGTTDTAHRRAVYEAIRPIVDPGIAAVLDDYKMCVGVYLVKEPQQQQSVVPMHVDTSFVDESRFVSINLWCPLTDVDAENGCLDVVSGSHHHGAQLRPTSRDPVGCHPFHDVMPLLKEKYARRVEIKAGNAVIYNSRLLHGSDPNRSTRRRVVVGCVIVPREAAILQSVLISPTEAESFEVTDPFFWSFRVGERPTDLKSLGVVKHYIGQFTEADVLSSRHFHQVMPS
jgi:hypothetical protein